MRRALDDPVDRVVVADRRRDGLGPVDHDLGRGHVPTSRHQPGAPGLGRVKFDLTRATSTRGQAPHRDTDRAHLRGTRPCSAGDASIWKVPFDRKASALTLDPPLFGEHHKALRARSGLSVRALCRSQLVDAAAATAAAARVAWRDVLRAGADAAHGLCDFKRCNNLSSQRCQTGVELTPNEDRNKGHTPGSETPRLAHSRRRRAKWCLLVSLHAASSMVVVRTRASTRHN